jgi:hypothetical protein
LPAKSLADGARPAYRKEIGDGSIAVQFASYNSKICPSSDELRHIGA